MKKELKRICFDVIPNFWIARCCGTCDCAWPNEAVEEHEIFLKKNKIEKLPGVEYPYPLWCKKFKAETFKYGMCKGWEED